MAEKANQADLIALNTRVDTIITTPVDGVSAQEIIDARQGAATLGANIEAFKTDYAKHNSYNLFSNKSEKNRTSNGVTFTWNDDFTCNVSGTSTSSTAFITIYHSVSVIPIWMKLGETYHVYFATTDTNVSLRFSYYKNNSETGVTHVYVRGNQDITIPEDITGIAIRLVVLRNRTVNGVVTTAMTNALSNKELEAKIKGIISKEPLFYVTFIDDDGFKEALENWEKISDMSGAKITSALITERVGSASRVNWDDVKRLTGKGFEFVSHTHAHVDFDITPEDDIIEDFIISQQLLRENGCNVNFFSVSIWEN